MKQIDLYNVLIKPLITEKSNILAQKYKQITFKVLKSATKTDIKQAFELIFKVKISQVAVLNVAGKEKKFSRFIGRRANWKKAYITIADGYEFNLESHQG